MEMLALVFAGLMLKGFVLYIYSKWEPITLKSLDVFSEER